MTSTIARSALAAASATALAAVALASAPALADGADAATASTVACAQDTLTGTTLWNLGDGDITERHKTSDVALGEVNADGWADTLRLYGATTGAYDSADVTVTITGGTFNGTYNTLSTPAAGRLQANGYTAPVGSVTVTSVTPTTVTLHLDGLAAMSSWSVNVPFTSDASQGDITLTETENVVSYSGSDLCPVVASPTPTQEPTEEATTTATVDPTEEPPVDDTTGAGPDTTTTQEPTWIASSTSSPSPSPEPSSTRSTAGASAAPSASSDAESAAPSVGTSSATLRPSPRTATATPTTSSSAASATSSPAVTTAQTTEKALAHTGTEAGWIAVAAAALIAVGALVAWRSRR